MRAGSSTYCWSPSTQNEIRSGKLRIIKQMHDEKVKDSSIQVHAKGIGVDGCKELAETTPSIPYLYFSNSRIKIYEFFKLKRIKKD